MATRVLQKAASRPRPMIDYFSRWENEPTNQDWWAETNELRNEKSKNEEEKDGGLYFVF